MKRLFWSGRGACAIAAVASVGGCTALLGLDNEYALVDGGGAGGSGGTTSTSATSSSGTGAGAGPTSTSATSSSGTGGASGTGVVGKLGEPCMEVQQLACGGNAQKLQLICGTEHTWEKNGTCIENMLCDTAMGADQGTCKSVVAECAGKSPGDVVCAGVMRAACGPDLVTTEAVETCPYVCSAGQCTGVCLPGENRCAANVPQTCDMSGIWQNGAACSAQMPVCAAGACKVTPSCSGLQPTCGPSGNESCCAIRAITGGTYNRSNDAAYPATVSDFLLDRFEITVGRFRKFVESYPMSKPAAGAGAHPLIAGSGWQSGWNASLAADQVALKAAVKCEPTYKMWTDTAGGNENKPMNCMSWYEAFAFCAWDGGRLPTEAEWNYAAAGGNEQRQYPWGAAAPDKVHAVYDCTGDGSASAQCAVTDILNVGAKSMVGDGKWGQADLAGSVLEWNMDLIGPYVSQCNDCSVVSQGTGAGTDRALRGGGWTFAAPKLLSSFRGNIPPTDHILTVGARCSKTP